MPIFDKTIEVTEQEIKGFKIPLVTEQIILAILKSKGAPVKGTITLIADEKYYSWIRTDLPDKISFRIVERD